MRRDTEIRCDNRFLLIVEYRLKNLRFPVGQLELPRERAPRVGWKYQPSQKLGFALRRSRENGGWNIDTVAVPVTLLWPEWDLPTRFRLMGHSSHRFGQARQRWVANPRPPDYIGSAWLIANSRNNLQ